ncbi:MULTISPECIES: isoprenyl transferase [unclassified Gemella]|uniref:isoprenyl transferase n=1 Tax=unclassified Gemella TaxID=2624949 RepID=UPI0010738FB7|nr:MULTISPECIES: isoprenyl transferase [unclassified Gemella]MBF0710085.1 isoprenyl transferase [Gemella sp. GL1.1]MBF0746164.1 isoprenyl transferase [Gemella sp. 19428wG2_WT2a]NYS27429.1 isoprenyl transferase [Gemella sp. GL1]TFU60449.1 isoprenyl transferase [Gemella sp. WT2a]
MFNIFKKKEIKKEQGFNLKKIPKHIAIIMDGNGRWAQKRNLPRIKGHYEGMQTVKKITKYASDLGVKYLTLYAFSTENWSRPKREVSYLMDLPEKMFSSFMPELMANNVKVLVIGDIEELPQNTQQAVNNAIKKTSDNTGLNLIFALNYGSKKEILDAIKNISYDVKQGNITVENIDEQLLESKLYTKNIPAPDLLIRTSGEQRLSNFLLWQLAYSEFIFTNVTWPDYTEKEFLKSLLEYQSRDRRYGGLHEG